MSDDDKNLNPDGEGDDADSEGETSEELATRLKAVEEEKKQLAEENARLKDLSALKSDAIAAERTLRKKAAQALKEKSGMDEKVLERIEETTRRTVEEVMAEKVEKEAINEFISDFPFAEEKWKEIETRYQQEYQDTNAADKRVYRKRLEYVASVVDEDSYNMQKENNIRKEERRNIYGNFQRSATVPPVKGGKTSGKKAITPEQEAMSQKFGLDPETVYS